MFRQFAAVVLITVSLVWAAPLMAEPAAAPASTGFKPLMGSLELAEGDSIVFLGDSITHQCLYTQYLEDYFITRYPKMRLKFHNAGISGDRAADALARFDGDVAQYKPKYVTILLGMNDGSYKQWDASIFAAYEKGMTQILDRLEAIGAKAIPMGPTILDSRAVAMKAPAQIDSDRARYYNAVMAYYGAWQREQAMNRGLAYVDMWGPLMQVTLAERAKDPKFTLVRDAVHPDAPGQAIMAYAVLEDLKASRGVSSITAGYTGDKWVVNATGGKVEAIEGSGDSVAFTFTADALPWVLPEEAQPGIKLVHGPHRLSNEKIRVVGLPPGKYELKIDGQVVGVYPHGALAGKIELQDNPKTPQYQQALAVAMLNKERNEKAVRPLRNHWHALKASSRKMNPEQLAAWRKNEFEPKLPALRAACDEYLARVYDAAQPKARRYEVRRVN